VREEEARDENERMGGRDEEEEEEEEVVEVVAVMVLRAINGGRGVGREGEEEAEEAVVAVVMVLRAINWGLGISMRIMARSAEIRQQIMITRLDDGGRSRAKNGRMGEWKEMII